MPRAYLDSSTSYCRGRFGGGGGGGDDGLGIGCPLLNVAGLPTEDNLPIGKRVEGGGNNGLFSNSLTLSEIAGGFSGSVSFL
jgi:hypothetical protein